MRTEPQCGWRNCRSLYLDQRRVGEHPAIDGAVVDLQTAFEEEFPDVAVAQRVAQVPGDGLHDQRRLEVPTLEVAAGLSLQLKGESVQDHAQLRCQSSKLGGYG